MKLERLDLFFLHNMTVADEDQAHYDGTPRALFVDSAFPAFEQLREKGRIGVWGITGIGVPDAVPLQETHQVLDDEPPVAALADAVAGNKSLVAPLAQSVGMDV